MTISQKPINQKPSQNKHHQNLEQINPSNQPFNKTLIKQFLAQGQNGG